MQEFLPISKHNKLDVGHVSVMINISSFLEVSPTAAAQMMNNYLKLFIDGFGGFTTVDISVNGEVR